jgi:hypothetical protein
MSQQFTPDPELEKMAQVFAGAAVEFSTKHFHLGLDFSDASVQYIEGMLDHFHRGLAQTVPSPEMIEGYSKMFGSYLGETFRRNHAATWGAVAHGPDKIASMRSERTGTIFYPLTRVYERLTKGDTRDVYRYYHKLIEGALDPSEAQPAPDLATPEEPVLPEKQVPPVLPAAEEKRPFWKRFLRR